MNPKQVLTETRKLNFSWCFDVAAEAATHKTPFGFQRIRAAFRSPLRCYSFFSSASGVNSAASSPVFR